MKNFIFKSASADSDLQKIISSLSLLLTEQRAQRVDLQLCNSRLNRLIKLIIDQQLQSKVDDFYERTDSPTDSPETSE